MKQSKRASLGEAVTQTVVGYFINIGAQILIFPLFGLGVTISQNLAIGACFTGISLTRQYLLRRLFN